MMPSDKPKILQVITRAELGGAQKHVQTLIEGLREEFDFTLAVGEEGYLSEVIGGIGGEVRLIPSLGRSIDPGKDFEALMSLKALIDELQPNLLHCHSSKAGILGRIAAKITRRPVIFTAHGWAFNPGVPPQQRLVGLLAEAICAPLSSRIICVSSYDRQLALKTGLFPRHKLVRIWNGIEDLPPLRSAYAQASICKILMIARFARQKRQDRLIEAMTALPCDQAELWLIGEGENLEDCRQLATKLQIPVKFLGAQTNIAHWIDQADILALIADWEGLPISILEGMRAGKPILASETGGIGEQVIDGETGLLVSSEASSLRAALTKMAGDPDLRIRLGQGSRKRFERYFLASRMLQEVKNQYHSLLGRAEKPRKFSNFTNDR